MNLSLASTPRSVSKPVTGGQVRVHPDLTKVVQRHLDVPSQNALHAPSVAAFRALLPELLDSPLVLDSGCGTGASTLKIAIGHPDALVIGIDQSAKRLERLAGSGAHTLPDNVRLIRARAETFWWLVLEHALLVEKHYLLFPNPWPKAKHLRRRWHGHPVFPTLIQLGGEIELRCNWEVYAQEFSDAINQVTGHRCPATEYTIGDNSLSPFEKKYSASGHRLWRVQVPFLKQSSNDSGRMI